MREMLKVKFHRADYILSAVCVTCGTTYVIEKVEGILFEGDKRIGNICQECIKMGSPGLSTALKKQSERLRERVRVLDELSNHSIDCPPWNEYLLVSGERNTEAGGMTQDEKTTPQMIMSRVFLIGEGIVPREEIEGLRTEHMRIFLTEMDVSRWPSEIHHLKKYAQIQIDDSYLFRMDEGT
jgi:hypothetical protein